MSSNISLSLNGALDYYIALFIELLYETNTIVCVCVPSLGYR